MRYSILSLLLKHLKVLIFYLRSIQDFINAIHLGKGTTFYSWLDVSPSASSKEIARAYRKKSIVLQYVF